MQVSYCTYTDQLNKFSVHVFRVVNQEPYIRWVPLTAIQIRLLCWVCCGNDNSCDCLQWSFHALYVVFATPLPMCIHLAFKMSLRYFISSSPCFPSNKTTIISENRTFFVYISIQILSRPIRLLRTMKQHVILILTRFSIWSFVLVLPSLPVLFRITDDYRIGFRTNSLWVLS